MAATTDIRSATPVWLFVAYGGGHIATVIPLALRARALSLCEPLVLALTTAASAAREAGLPTVGFKNFLRPGDEPWLAVGRQLAAQLPTAPADIEESAAYLGLSYADLVVDHGPAIAENLYARSGRQAFLPRHFLERVIKRVKPQLVCATNSPRAERAALMAAGKMGIPCVCVVDLFAIDEKRWIGLKGFASRVCVFNEAVRQSLLDMERRPEEVLVTGNPAFDRLFDSAPAQRANHTRERLGSQGRRVLLWASQHEPMHHPWRQQVGDTELPSRVLQTLIDYVHSREDWQLAVRPHPSEAEPVLPSSSKVVLAGRDWPLTELLHASDVVCTLTSTVGLEAHLLGKPVVQVGGSMFEDAAPFVAMGIAIRADLNNLGSVLDALPIRAQTTLALPALPALATGRVMDVMQSLCH